MSDLIARLEDRRLPAHGGRGDWDHSMKHHWNLTPLDSELHSLAAAALREKDDQIRASQYLLQLESARIAAAERELAELRAQQPK